MTIEHNIFQSAACDKATYEYNNTGVIPKEWGLKENENVLREITMSVYQNNTPKLYVTNLPCSNKNQNVSVYKLNTASTSEAIDPTGTTLPQPSLEFKFTDQSLFKKPTSEIESFLNQLKDARVKVRSGFVKCDLSQLRNENGEYTQPLIGNYFKPVDTNPNGSAKKSEFGFFIIEDAQFNYETCEIKVTATHLLFDIMNNCLTYDRDSCMLPQHLTNSLHKTEQSSYYRKYKLLDSFNLLDNMFYIDKNGTTPKEPLDPRCDYTYMGEKLTQHLDLNQFVNLCRVGSPNFNSYNIRDNKDSLCEITRLAQPLEPGTNFTTQRPSYKNIGASGSYTMFPLYTYLTNETIAETLREFSIMNDLFVLPTNNAFNEKAQGEAANKIFDNTKSNWRLVGGTKPSEHPFPSTNTSVISDKHLGQYYNTTSDIYKISPYCVLEKSNEKEKIGNKKVDLIKTIDVPTDEVFGVNPDTGETNSRVSSPATNIESFNFNHPVAVNKDSGVLDTYGGMIYTTGEYDGNKIFRHYTFPSFGAAPLPEGKWFDDSGDFLHLFGVASDLPDLGVESVGAVSEAIMKIKTPNKNEYSEVRFIDGRKVISPKAFHHDPPFAYGVSKIELKGVDPVVAYVDKNNNATTKRTNEKHSVDLSHVSTKQHIDCSERILKRVNGDNLHPLYKITWTMKDDPFLRVGTLVYFPLRDFYVKAFITKQSRSFDKGAKLKCEAWVIEETTIPTMDYHMDDGKVNYRLNKIGPFKTKEELLFTWKPSKGWSGQMLRCEFTINMELDGETYEMGKFVDILQPDLSYQIDDLIALSKKLGFKFNYEKANFTLQTRFLSEDKLDVIPLVKNKIGWDNSDKSIVHSGEVRAQNTIVPLLHNHWMRG